MRWRAVWVLCALAVLARAQDVSIPWEEFKSLYRERVEKEVLMQTVQPAARPWVYSIDEARYRVTVSRGEARGDVLISGKVLSGDPEPIPLFGADMVLTDIRDVAGGALLGSGFVEGASFLPQVGTADFELVLGFLVPVFDQDEARAITFRIPRALRNSLELTLPDDARILEHPGIGDNDGIYHFAPSSSLGVRYLDQSRGAGAGIVEIDAVSRIRIDTKRVFIETHFQPARTLPETVVLQAPAASVIVASSLQPSRIRPLESDQYELTLGTNDTTAFHVEVTLEGVGGDGAVSIQLPTILGNSGRQDRFVVDEPEHGQLSVDAEGLVTQLPTERLGEALQALVQPAAFYMTAPSGTPIQLTLKRFAPVETPSFVLDAQYFFASIDDNGTVLSTLAMDLPPEVGAHLRVAAVPGAEIWSLTVNGEKATVYRDESDTWIIPLAPGNPSHVELSFLRHGPPLGLQGTIQADVPATGLPARELRVAVAMPARVDLLVLDGPVNPAQPENWVVPESFAQNRYNFSRSFYKGEGISLAASYKEPLNQPN